VALVAAGVAVAGIAYGTASADQPAVRRTATAVSAKPIALPDLRLRLEHDLGHHAILMTRLMRGEITHEQDLVEQTRNAVDDNTDALTAAMTTAYGANQAESFRAEWTGRVDALADYAKAVGRKGGSQESLSRAKSTIEETQSQIVAGSSRIDVPVASFLAQADAYAVGDYLTAYGLERQSYAAMFSAGAALAAAAVPGPVPPQEQLRTQLVQLLGEHVELAFDATRAVVDRRPAEEMQAAAGALDANTRDFLAGMTAAVGQQATAVFGDIWGRHIDALMQFSVGVASGDQAAQASARAAFGRFPAELATLLGEISSQPAASANVVAGLQQHDQQLLQQVTAYAAKDYRGAQEITTAAYDRMLAIAGTVTQAIERHAAKQMPQGAAATGLGGMAGR
jgi:hypothetical protein